MSSRIEMQLNSGHVIGISIVNALICLFVGLMIGRGCSGVKSPEPIVHHDTIAVHDTLRLREHTKTIYVIKWDTLYLEKPASQDIARDSLCDGYVTIPITQSEYRDTFATDSTRAEVAVLFSGYNARIDSVGINYQATIQPVVYEKESGWGWSITVGPYVGYGVTINNGRVLAGPEVGLGVQFGIGYQKKFKSLKRR